MGNASCYFLHCVFSRYLQHLYLPCDSLCSLLFTAFTFTLGKGVVVRGIDEAVKLMSKGQEVKLTIPPMYGYGVNGYPPIIPANATLTIEMELVSFSEFTRDLTPDDEKEKKKKG